MREFYFSIHNLYPGICFRVYYDNFALANNVFPTWFATTSTLHSRRARWIRIGLHGALFDVVNAIQYVRDGHNFWLTIVGWLVTHSWLDELATWLESDSCSLSSLSSSTSSSAFFFLVCFFKLCALITLKKKATFFIPTRKDKKNSVHHFYYFSVKENTRKCLKLRQTNLEMLYHRHLWSCKHYSKHFQVPPPRLYILHLWCYISPQTLGLSSTKLRFLSSCYLAVDTGNGPSASWEMICGFEIHFLIL